jgi:hypothetical protein
VDHAANFTRHQQHAGDGSVWNNLLEGENTGSEKSASTVAGQELLVIGAAFNSRQALAGSTVVA